MSGFRQSSVALKVIVLIVAVVSLLMSVFGVLGYRYYSERQWAAFNRAQEVGADQFQTAVAPAVWSLNYPMVAKLMESPMQEPSVEGLELRLEDRRLFMWRGADGRVSLQDAEFDTHGLIETRRSLDYEGQALGSVHIYASRSLLDRELQSARWFIGGMLVLLDIILSLALFFSLRPLVLQPLSILGTHANRIADGEAIESGSLQDMHFHGELEGLKNSITVMLSELESRNAELARSTYRFERVIRLFPSPIALFDSHGKMLYLNDKFVQTCGYTLDAIPDLHAWTERAFPETNGRQQAMQRWKQALDLAINNDKFIRPAIYEICCLDGSVKSVEVCGILSADVNIGLLNDVSERIRSEQELARHRENLEELVRSRTLELEHMYRRLRETEFAMNHAGISIQWIDAATGRVLFVNQRACELYGYTQDALLDMQAADITADFSVAALQNLAPRLEEAGQISIESLAMTAGGGVIPIETVLYLQRSEDDPDGHFITFSTDITQRKAAAEALLAAKAAAEAAARTRSEFLANMSHEIRTPMNAIIGMSQLALRTALDAKQRNYIEKVHSSAESLLGILNDILDFSKVEAGHLNLERMEFRLDSVIDNVCNVVGLRADEKNLELVLDISPDVPRQLVGDPTRLGQILVNLAGNAVKFTQRGYVLIGARLLAQDQTSVNLEFFVRDSGIGITDEQQSRLFSAFSQADSSITRRFGGTGLGLAICKRLVDLLDGEISVSSTPDQGSTFSFSARFERGRAIPALAEDSVPPQMLNDYKLLVVDDNPVAREILAGIVRLFGLQVDLAASGQEAMVMLRKTRYDLLLCDWKMPGQDGIELVRALRRENVHAPGAIVMVSAYGIEQLRHETVDLGLAGILSKPANPSSMLDAIVTALGHPYDSQHLAERLGIASAPSIRFDGEAILLVEDNPINQELAQELLSSSGLVVTLANNGLEALERLNRADFACVLMDVQMPEMDGLEATRRIRRDPRWRDLPIIAMTAGAMAEEREQTLVAGMNDYIAKPINVDHMFNTIGRWIKRGAALAVVSAPVDAISGLPGLDIEFGLKSVFSKPALYRKLLRAYIEHSGPSLQKFEEALSMGDRSELARLAHGLKGGSGTLGLHEVYAAAVALERPDANADPALLYAALRREQEQALDSIRSYLASS